MKRFHSCRQTGVATPRGSRLRRDAEICTHFTDNSAALQPLLPRRNSVKVVEKGRWGRGEKREEEGKKSGRQREREGEEIGKKRKEERKEEKKGLQTVAA